MGDTKQEAGKLREWWWNKQGLDGSLAGAAPAEVLKKTGWVRSAGGAAPYLTLFSRAGISVETASTAVSRLEIHELPSARNCVYVLPAADFALGLRVGQSFAGGEEKVALRLGVKQTELDTLRTGVLKILKKGPLDPDGMRRELGPLVRNLGEEGKKKGLTTTLPAVLGRLQAEGEIRRVAANGRLDQQRYQYTLWNPNPLRGLSLSAEEAAVELARRYFGWIGPATPTEFQAFSALGAKAASAALASLKLVPLSPKSGRLMLADDHEAFRSFQPSKEPRYALVGSLDGLALFRRDIESLRDGGAPSVSQGLKDWESHAILDRGRWIGSWEYDRDREQIAWAVWTKKDRALQAAVRRTEEFIRRDLGDARSFSLDSPKSRAPRIAALKKGY